MQIILKKRIVPLLLLLSLLLSVVACGAEPAKPDPEPKPECTAHVDADKDGKCDNCGAAVSPAPCDAHTDANGDGKCDVCGADVPIVPARTTLDLFDGNAACFRVVLAGSVGDAVASRADAFVEALRDMGIAIDDPVADSDASKVQDCEIVIGSAPQNRPENCNIDAHGVGMKGYLIKVVGDRVVIVGGSDDATVEALDFFIESCLQIFEDSEKPGKTSIKCDYEKEHASRYSITEFTLDGVDLGAYTLVASAEELDGKCLEYAAALQGAFYEYTGKWLEIVESDEGVGHPFYVRHTGNAGKTGFRVANVDGVVAMECEYENTFARSVSDFVEDVLAEGFGKMTLDAGESFTEDAYKIYYSEFGAIDNAGRTEANYVDSFAAMYAAHEKANASGQTVCADDGWLYYIGQTTKSIPVLTDVYFGTATFVIDDRNVDRDHRVHNIFDVNRDFPTVTMTVDDLGTDYKLSKDATNVGFKLDYDALLIPSWSGHKIYVRYGANANSGADQQEVLLVDRDGNIDPSTPLLWDYGGMDTIEVIRVDDKPITIEGGTFVTWANTHSREYYSYGRGFAVFRSNTTFKNVEHLVQRETDTGAPYNGFFTTNRANHVVFDGITVTGHTAYAELTKPTTRMGTYDMTSAYANDVTWKNVKQSNSITNQTYWGVHASNFCKNLSLLGSEISRFDAHQGMYNCTIKDSKIGYALLIIGTGDLLCENVTRVAGESFIYMRDDYGSTWEGDVSIVNCKHEGYGTAYTDEPDGSISILTLIDGAYTLGHNFGYQCYLPQNVVVDHFEGPECPTYILLALPSAALTDKINPVVMPNSVTVKNMKKNSVSISSNPSVYAKVTYTVK